MIFFSDTCFNHVSIGNTTPSDSYQFAALLRENLNTKAIKFFAQTLYVLCVINVQYRTLRVNLRNI